MAGFKTLQQKKALLFLERLILDSADYDTPTNPARRLRAYRSPPLTPPHVMDRLGISAVESPWAAAPSQTSAPVYESPRQADAVESHPPSQYVSEEPPQPNATVQDTKRTAPVPPRLPESKEVPLDGVPPYLELGKSAMHPGMSSEWDDPRAGIDLDVAVRSRTARRAAYESRNPPSIVRHLAQAFVGKNSAYTESAQYAVGPGGARNLVDASAFTDSSGFLTDYDAAHPPEAAHADAKGGSAVGVHEPSLDSNLAYPRDLRPAGPFCAYRPRGIRSTRISIQEDGSRGWQHLPRHHRQ